MVVVQMVVSEDEARSLQVGERVGTTFSGRVTLHTVSARREGAVSQTTVLLQVSPPVPKSSGAEAWIDAAWFQRVPA